MAGEIALSKLFENTMSAHIVDDVNVAYRNYFLARSVVIIPVWYKLSIAAGAINTVSEIYELSERTHFTFEVSTIGAMNQGVAHLQGSLSGNAWNDIADFSLSLNNTSAFTTMFTDFPYRYYRVGITTALGGATGATVSVLMASKLR